MNDLAWSEIRSWSAFVVSVIALIVSVIWNGLVHRRTERHRLNALKEGDLLRLEEYWRLMHQTLVSLNRRRAELCDPMRERSTGKTIGWSKYEIGSVRSPTNPVPLLPIDESKLAEQVFEATLDVWLRVSVFEGTLRDNFDIQWVVDAHKKTQDSIKDADGLMNTLKDTITESKRKLRK